MHIQQGKRHSGGGLLRTTCDWNDAGRSAHTGYVTQMTVWHNPNTEWQAAISVVTTAPPGVVAVRYMMKLTAKVTTTLQGPVKTIGPLHSGPEGWLSPSGGNQGGHRLQGKEVASAMPEEHGLVYTAIGRGIRPLIEGFDRRETAMWFCSPSR